MMKLLLILSLILSLAVPVSALEIEAPPVPDSGKNLMPENTENFSDAVFELLQNAMEQLRPDLAEATRISLSIFSAAAMVSLLRTFSGIGKGTLEWAGVAAAAGLLLKSSNALIHLAANTIQELSDYGKLLFPVMTSAVAAQGGVSSSAALYVGTTVFDTLLCSLISGLLVPGIYLFLALAAGYAATGEDMLKKLRDLIKSCISWCLKTLLTVFTTYMSITGVVSGTTDAAALKATKVTISSVVPVVGGILSDASEAVLVSAGLLKNAAGIYGILAIAAVFLGPFLRIGLHYLIMKATAAFCSIFGSGGISSLMEDFSVGMGLLLAMTGAVSLLLLISTICFMKGVG